MKYKIAIFDMDGTILNTLTDIAGAINHTLDSFGMPVRSIEEIRMFVGNGIYKLTQRAVPVGTDEATIDKVYKAMLDYYGKHSDDTTAPYEGIAEAIKAIRQMGIKTAVVSNKANFAVLLLADKFFPGLFDYAIGEHDGFAPKPAPDMINKILSDAKLTSSDAVYIGDSDVDLMTAANSGMDCISVEWGFRDRTFLENHGADIIIDSPSMLPALM